MVPGPRPTTGCEESTGPIATPSSPRRWCARPASSACRSTPPCMPPSAWHQLPDLLAWPIWQHVSLWSGFQLVPTGSRRHDAPARSRRQRGPAPYLAAPDRRPSLDQDHRGTTLPTGSGTARRRGYGRHTARRSVPRPASPAEVWTERTAALIGDRPSATPPSVAASTSNAGHGIALVDHTGRAHPSGLPLDVGDVRSPVDDLPHLAGAPSPATRVLYRRCALGTAVCGVAHAPSAYAGAATPTATTRRASTFPPAQSRPHTDQVVARGHAEIGPSHRHAGRWITRLPRLEDGIPAESDAAAWTGSISPRRRRIAFIGLTVEHGVLVARPSRRRQVAAPSRTGIDVAIGRFSLRTRSAAAAVGEPGREFVDRSHSPPRRRSSPPIWSRRKLRTADAAIWACSTSPSFDCLRLGEHGECEEFRSWATMWSGRSR